MFDIRSLIRLNEENFDEYKIGFLNSFVEMSCHLIIIRFILGAKSLRNMGIPRKLMFLAKNISHKTEKCKKEN